MEAVLGREAYKGKQGAVAVKALLATPQFFQALASLEAEQQKGNEATILQSYRQRYGLEEQLAIALYLDTHSVDLLGYKLQELSLLRDDGGGQYRPLGWMEDQGGSSHHRSGVLLFPRVDGEGRDLLTSARVLELVVRDVDRVPERAFRWELPISYPPQG